MHARTKRIPLTRGKFAVVDAEDYDGLADHVWYASKSYRAYYAQRHDKSGERASGAERRTVHMHRVVVDAPDDLQVDHINGDGLDNRKCNLRLVTHAQNKQGFQSKQRGTTSRYRGICWNVYHGMWRARLTLFGQEHHVGYFHLEDDAHEAYQEARRRLIEDGRVA